MTQCFCCHGRGHISKKCPQKNQTSNEQYLSREEKQLYLEEGRCFSCREQRHTNRRCPNRDPGNQVKDQREVTLGEERATNLGPWQYLEDLERSPWTEEISLESNATTRTQDWLVKISIAQDRRVGSLAPKEENDDQKGDTVLVEDPATAGWGPPSDPRWEPPSNSKWDTSPNKDEDASEDERTFVAYMNRQRGNKEQQQMNATLKGDSSDQMWPGEPWIDSQMMSIKLTIPKGEERWEEVWYSYWEIYRGVPTLWGTVGMGYPAYHKPTYFVEGQDRTETPKGLPILRMVFREKLIHEQDVFNDIQTQATEHSIRHSWKALKRDAQLKQRIAKGAVAQLEDMQQTGELQVWELDMLFPYIPIPPVEAPLLRELRNQARTRDRRAAKETPEDPETKIIELKDLVPLYRGSAEMVQPEERKHMLMHEYFCRRRYCKYHNTA